MSFNLISTEFFKFIFNNFNYFVIFRSYLHKFAWSYLIIYIILIFASILFLRIYKKKKTYFVLCLIMVINVSPFFFSNPTNIPIWNSIKKVYAYDNISTELINTSLNLNKLIKNDYGNVLSLPFTKEYELHLSNNKGYVGPSIITLLNIVKNYYGTNNPSVRKIFDDFDKNNISQIVNELEKNDIKYILLNKTNLDTFEYYLERSKFNEAENLKRIIEKINFNLVYSNELYSIFRKNNQNKKNCLLLNPIRATKVYIQNICDKEITIDEIQEILKNFKNYNFYETFSNEPSNYIFKYFTFQYFGKKNISEKILSFKNSSRNFVMIYKNQIKHDILLILSFFLPLIILSFLIFKKK
jgi:hypothetical protein